MTVYNANLLRLNGSVLSGIKSAGLDRRETHVTLDADGALHQTGDAVIRAAPTARFTTSAARALVALLNPQAGHALPYLALDAANGIELVQAKVDDAAPGYKTGTVHGSRKMVRGQLMIDSLRWQSGGTLEASATVFGLSADGTTDPVAVSTIALPALPVATEQLVLSAITLNGVSIPKVRSVEITYGHKTENNAAECYLASLPYPTMLMQAGVAGPSEITFAIELLDFGATIGNGVLSCTFTALTNLGVGLGTNTLTALVNGSIARDEGLDGSNGTPGARRITGRGTFDGTTKPWGLTVA
jgi:hypothetical protein